MKKIFKQLKTKLPIQPQKWFIRFNGLPIILAAMADYASVIQYANVQIVLLTILCLTGFINLDEKKNIAKDRMQKIDHKTRFRMTRLAHRHQNQRRQY